MPKKADNKDIANPLFHIINDIIFKKFNIISFFYINHITNFVALKFV